MEYKIVDYILEDLSCIIKDGISNDINDFPMTKVLSQYLVSNSFQPTIIEGMMYDILMKEYVDYLLK